MAVLEKQKGPLAFDVTVTRLPAKGMAVPIEANEDQRAALAAEHGLSELGFLKAELLVAPWKKDGVKVTGRLRATLTQPCIVTLEPVGQEIDTQIEAIFVPEGSRLARPDHLAESEMLLDADGPDAPEIFSGLTIDAGGLVEEHFALAIDPYPRKEGAELPAAPAEAEEAPRGPLYDKLKGLAGKS